MFTDREAIASYKSIYKNKYIRFSLPIANAIGIKETVLIKIVEDWCEKNEGAENTQFYHEGRWWTRLSYPKIAEQYPCIGTDKAVQKLILKLESMNILISGNFNLLKCDRTKWYCVNQVTVGRIFLEATENPTPIRSDHHYCSSEHDDCGSDLDHSKSSDDLYIRSKIRSKKIDQDETELSFSSNAEQAKPETEEPDPSPTIPSLVVQNPNLETELKIQTDSETQEKVNADAEEKETPLPPFAVALTTETNEVVKSKDRVDPRFDKKIPFSGRIDDASYKNELKFFRPVLEGSFFEIEGIKRSFERQNAVNAKTLLCMLNEKGIDAIANLEKFIDFYYTKTLARTEHYKNHSFDKETLKVAVLKAITKKIADDDTEILIQLVSTFSKDAKAIANPQKPISEPLPEKKGIPFNPAFAEKLKSKQNQHRRKSSDISPLDLVNDVSSTLEHRTA